MLKLKKTDRDRRSHPRYAANCQCWIEQDTVTLFGTVTNLSPNGLFLRTLPLVEQGSLIDIKLNLDTGEVIAKGKVCWANNAPNQKTDEKNTHPPGIGIELIEFNNGEDSLTNYFARQSIIPMAKPDSD